MRPHLAACLPRRLWSALPGVAVDSRKTETVLLPRRVPVILMYWTVDLREDQRVGFKRDLYERDGAVLEALAGDFVVHRVPGE